MIAFRTKPPKIDSFKLERILYRALSNGLSFKVSAGIILTLTTPLIITREELEEAFQIVESAIGQVARADS